MGSILSKCYVLTTKDYNKINTWKRQGINCQDWIKTLLDYNSSEYCERCGNKFIIYKWSKVSSKVLDHDHNKIYNNIRGNICRSCNNNLRHIDAGTMPDFYPHFLRE